MTLFVLHLDRILKDLHAHSPNMATSTQLLAYIICDNASQSVSFLSEYYFSRPQWLTSTIPPLRRVRDNADFASAISVEPLRRLTCLALDFVVVAYVDRSFPCHLPLAEL